MFSRNVGDKTTILHCLTSQKSEDVKQCDILYVTLLLFLLADICERGNEPSDSMKYGEYRG